jgi:hypothetical protein
VFFNHQSRVGGHRGAKASITGLWTYKTFAYSATDTILLWMSVLLRLGHSMCLCCLLHPRHLRT